MPYTQERYFWTSYRSDPMEPAQVGFREGVPYEVWFAGNDFPVDPACCTIGDEIFPPRAPSAEIITLHPNRGK